VHSLKDKSTSPAAIEAFTILCKNRENAFNRNGKLILQLLQQYGGILSDYDQAKLSNICCLFPFHNCDIIFAAINQCEVLVFRIE
jgi:hypothetical protein